MILKISGILLIVLGPSMECPNNTDSTYFNHKYSHSIVLMTICDANYVIRFIDIGAYGRRSDGDIFNNSAIGRAFDKGRMNIPQPTAIGEREPVLPYCFVGDEVFPLKPYLLCPYPRPYSGFTQEQKIYNYRRDRARQTIENTFGILASQWRMYRKPIIASPENAKVMVSATICLHNWLCKQNNDIYVFPTLVDDESNSFTPRSWRTMMEDGCAFKDISNCGPNMSAKQCIEIRNKFCHYLNNEGAIQWQNDINM